MTPRHLALFFSKVEKTESCWLWKGCLNHSGYGVFLLRAAYAVAYEHWNGAVPDGKELHHTCVVRRCVNPSHLIPITHAEHMMLTSQPESATHCKNGHSLDLHYKIKRKSGQGYYRNCKTCQQIRDKKRWEEYKHRVASLFNHEQAPASKKERA